MPSFRRNSLGIGLVVLSLVAPACGDDDGGASGDAGRVVDSGTVDAGPFDAGLDAAQARDGGGVIVDDAGATEDDGGPRADGGLTVRGCFDDDFVNPPTDGPDYDALHPRVGSHCRGTNHQDITGVERVVFLGDSVTVGSPPTLSTEFYRSRLADQLASHFGISAPNFLWKQHDHEGNVLMDESGAFQICAKWGGRTDDLMRDGNQVESCLPMSERSKRTLVVMTVGGNDISSITKAGLDGVPVEDIWTETREFVQLMREAVEWIKAPGRFPNGVFVVFASMYEFTDGTGDTAACDAAEWGGFSGAWDDPDALKEMVVWANEEFMRIAVDTQSDMIFLLESFCGHGYRNEDPSAPCYRGPGAERWFDLTCIHPTPRGHQEISDMFFDVIRE